MSALALLIACLLLGWLAARFGKPPASLAQNLNWFVLNIAYSALVLSLIPKLQFDWQLWYAVAAIWFVFAGSWLLFSLLGRVLHWSRERIGALTLLGGLGNTSFIGFPMIEALRGQEGLKIALIADQVGCFIALSVGGTIVASIYSGRSVAPLSIARRVITFPPFVSLLVGLAVGALGGWPVLIDGVLVRLGDTLVPLALFSVGLQLKLSIAPGQLTAMGLGLGWKLLLAPAIVFVIGSVMHVDSLILTVAVLESAMAPMISATILANQYNLEPRLANTLLGVGILLSLITVPLANALL